MPVQGSSYVVPSTTPFINPGQQTRFASGATSVGSPVILAGDLISAFDVASISVPSTTQMEQCALLPGSSSHTSGQRAVTVYGSPVNQYINQQPAVARSSSLFYSSVSEPTAH